MKRIVIRFDASGLGSCLYTEEIDLRSLGRLTLRRATSIEFSEPSQRWEVRDTRNERLFASPSRQACLDWERERFNR